MFEDHEMFQDIREDVEQTKKQIDSGEALNLSTTRIIYNIRG